MGRKERFVLREYVIVFFGVRGGVLIREIYFFCGIKIRFLILIMRSFFCLDVFVWG